MKGVLVGIEGADGSGKRTQCKLLESSLTKKGFETRFYSFPDYESDYGRMIKDHLIGKKTRSVKELALLYLTDMVAKAESIGKDIEKGNIVILDRYLFSTMAYQTVQGFDYESLKTIEEKVALPIPNVMFYIDLPASISMKRKKEQRTLEKSEADRNEKSNKIQNSVRKVYERMVTENFMAGVWIKIDGTGGLAKIHEEILRSFEAELNKIRAR